MRNQILHGFLVGLPVSLAVGAYGLVMGVSAAAMGLSALELLIKSFAVFAGASQFAVVNDWGAPIWVLLLATAAINLRYLMVGMTLQPMLAAAPIPLRLSALWYAADENWALTLAQRSKNVATGAGFLLGSGLAVLTCWQIGGQVGLAIGGLLPDPEKALIAAGLDFAFPAIFLALSLSFLRARIDWVPLIIAAATSYFLYEIMAEGSKVYIVGGALAGCLAAALVHRPGLMAHTADTHV